MDNWDFFDKIYCISIDKRVDRRAEAKRQFAKVGLLQRVEFVIVKRHAVNREQGIYQSHITCLQKGLKAGAERILVFEDDIIFKGFKPSRLRDVCAYLKAKPDWNMLFMGCIVNSIAKTRQKSLVRADYRCMAHAYGINREFAEELTRKPWQGIPFDDLLNQINHRFYAVYPMFAFQSNSPSDNQTFIIDNLRRMLGGLIFIQRANEFYHHHKMWIISSHIVVIAILVYLIGS
jgi:GR25 family glycosyltransferase involved in LPS biosynthesis